MAVKRDLCKYWGALEVLARRKSPGEPNTLATLIGIDNEEDKGKARGSKSTLPASGKHRSHDAPPSAYQRHRPVSRRAASAFDGRPYTTNAGGPSFHRTHSFTSPSSPVAPGAAGRDPRFSRAFSTVLGSPFLTTSDSSPQFHPGRTVMPRPPSPTPTADFSIIDVNEEDMDSNPFIPGSFPSTSRYLSHINARPAPNNAGANGASLKSLFPRLWDALSSPGRVLAPSDSVISSSPSTVPRSHVSQSQSWYISSSGRTSPVYWNPKGKSKSRLFASRSRVDLNDNINYSELEPLDGEEGELIDDEACFIDSTAIRGIDILGRLPPELALHILSMLSARSNGEPREALQALLSCRLVSSTWCYLASDNAVWRALFLARWNVDLSHAASLQKQPHTSPCSVRATLGQTWDFDLTGVGPKAKRVLGLSLPVVEAPITSAPLRLDWRVLYHQRLELEKRWLGTSRSHYEDQLCNTVNPLTRRMGGVFVPPLEVHKPYQPMLTKISGHTDSVYCLEFDSRRIITGSRDRTIKVWSLRTGRLLGTFHGQHGGSVLCLAFEKNWDRRGDRDASDEEAEEGGGDGANLLTCGGGARGFMVSGSSDCSICVWDLQVGAAIDQDSLSVESGETGSPSADDGDREVTAEVRQVLKGHIGGVLDLRIDQQWIVSCSKDAVIRVWDRKTLNLHRTLRGHEGPVNAVGLQTGRVVSASGDGKMILWDIDSGERLRTFEGHDRGLACIEFKDGLIVSGSNDCKIKVWNAATGDCIRTLMGHESLVRALSFDPRSGLLVSASYDKSVKLWDLATGRMVREFDRVHTSHIFDVKFDVARIVSTSHDQKIVVLDFSAGLPAAALFV